MSQCNCSAALCACPSEFYALLLRLATVQPLQTLSPQAPIISVLEYTLGEIVDVIPIADLLDPCVQIKFSGKQYLVNRPNKQNTQFIFKTVLK